MMVVLAVLVGCSSPESEAADVALRYASLAADDHVGRHTLACPDEQAAKSVEELKQEYEAAKRGILGDLVNQITAATASAARSVKTTTLSPAKDSGSVTIAVSIPKEGGAPTETTANFEMKKVEGGWCVVTGWAEKKRLDGIAAEAEALVSKVLPLITDWKFEEAGAAITQAEAKVAELPESDSRREGYTTTLDKAKKLLDAAKEGWVGGRWRVKENTDPMTDERNLVVSVGSVVGLPNSIGDIKPATIIFRCDRQQLEVYVATDSMLDSDWRYDSVSGQHRFGSEPAEKFNGGVSTDRRAVFLKKPKDWIAKFVAHEADGWTVELPLYNRKPQSARFDLTGASQALASIPDDCK